MRKKLKKRIVTCITAAILSLCLAGGGFGTISALAVTGEETDSSNSNNTYMYIGDYGKTVPFAQVQETTGGTLDGINALGHHADGDAATKGCSVLDGLMVDDAKDAYIESAKTNDAFTVTANADGTYSYEWKYTLPATTAFQYKAKQQATLILCDSINNPNIWRNAGNIAGPNGSLRPGGTWQTHIANVHGLATVKIAQENRNPDATSI